ncbi:hypothetical protein M3J09_010961 [Ascochyta lentis]
MKNGRGVGCRLYTPRSIQRLEAGRFRSQCLVMWDVLD